MGKVPGAKRETEVEDPLLPAEIGIGGGYPQTEVTAPSANKMYGQQAIEDGDDEGMHTIRRRS